VETLVFAVRNKHHDMHRWALLNDCPCDGLNERLREANLEDEEEDSEFSEDSEDSEEIYEE